MTETVPTEDVGIGVEGAGLIVVGNNMQCVLSGSALSCWNYETALTTQNLIQPTSITSNAAGQMIVRSLIGSVQQNEYFNRLNAAGKLSF